MIQVEYIGSFLRFYIPETGSFYVLLIRSQYGIFFRQQNGCNIAYICNVADPDPSDPYVLGLLDPDPFVRGLDPDPDTSITDQK